MYQSVLTLTTQCVIVHHQLYTHVITLLLVRSICQCSRCDYSWLFTLASSLIGISPLCLWGWPCDLLCKWNASGRESICEDLSESHQPACAFASTMRIQTAQRDCFFKFIPDEKNTKIEFKLTLNLDPNSVANLSYFTKNKREFFQTIHISRIMVYSIAIAAG